MNQEEEAKCLDILNRALARSRLSVDAKSPEGAIALRFTLYRLRREDRKLFGGKSVFDPLIMKVDGNNLIIINAPSILDYEINED